MSDETTRRRQEMAANESKILLTRLECLMSAIQRRDWHDTEFHYDRVLSQALKITEQRQRHYDATRVQPASLPADYDEHGRVTRWTGEQPHRMTPEESEQS